MLYVFRLSTLDSVENNHTQFDDTYQLKGRIVSSPDIDEKNYRIKLRIKEICDIQTDRFLDQISCNPIQMKGYTQVVFYSLSISYFLAQKNIQNLEVGDDITIIGSLKKIQDCFEKICNKKQSGYFNYLRRQRVYTEIYKSRLINVEERAGLTLIRTLIDFRILLENKIDRYINFPYSDLAKGLVISGKGSMSDELLSDFKKVGLIHIIVLSGSNVSIISVALFSILSKLPLLLRASIGIFSMSLFAIMTGAAPPVVRSVCMTSVPILIMLFQKYCVRKNKNVENKNIENDENKNLGYIYNANKIHENFSSRSFEEKYENTSMQNVANINEKTNICTITNTKICRINKIHSHRNITSLLFFFEVNSSIYTLVCIGIFLSIINPLMPIYDMSFQLSFMATFGLMSLGGVISDVLFFLPNRFGIKEIISGSLATQVFVLPLLLLISKETSLVFLIANLLVLPILPLTMLLVFVVMLSSFIAPPVATIIGSVSWIPLKWIMWVSEFFSGFNYSTINLKTLDYIDVVLIFSLLVPLSLVLKFIQDTNNRRCET